MNGKRRDNDIDDHFPVFRSDAFRRLPYEARGFIILVHEGVLPVANFRADEDLQSEVKVLLGMLGISYEKSEYNEEHGSGATFFISKSKFKAKRLARLDWVFSKGWVDESGILSSEAGTLYGIPPCCMKSYLQMSKDKEASKSASASQYYHDYPKEFRYLFYVPCSEGCIESIKLGREIKLVLERLDPDASAKWKEDSPVEKIFP